MSVVSSSNPNFDSRAPWYVIGVVTLVHLSFLGWDALHPETLSHVDRYQDRLTSLKHFLACLRDQADCNSGGIVGTLTQQGIPGDYFFHATLYGFGGMACVVIVQVLLMLVSIYGVYRIAAILYASQAVAITACAMYAMLPQTMVFPHLLSSEAIYDPLLVIAFWLMAEGWYSGFRLMPITLAALLFGVDTLVRPVTLLWPLLVMLIMLFARAPRLTFISFLVLAYLPVLLWMGFIGINTGRISLGESSHDMSHNLHDRVERIIELLPPDQQANALQRFSDIAAHPSGRTTTAEEYLQFGLNYPKTFLMYLGRDALVFFGKSGVEKLTIDYFGANDYLRQQLQDSNSGWRRQMETEGLIATIYSVATRAPVIIITSLIAAILMVMLWVGFVIAGYKLFVNNTTHSGQAVTLANKMLALTIFLFPLYIFSVSQTVDAMQSRHRAPAEFAICIFAAFGILKLRAGGKILNRLTIKAAQ